MDYNLFTARFAIHLPREFCLPLIIHWPVVWASFPSVHLFFSASECSA